MNITIIGAGNIGTQFAVHCATKGHNVIIYTNKFETISKRLEIVDESENIFLSSEILCATNDKEIAFCNADLVFITVPPFLLSTVANDILGSIKKSTKIALIPGTGGGECAFKKHLDNGGIVFGIQRVPSVARLVEYGKTVCASGYRNELFVSALPNKFSIECAGIIQDIFDIKCSILPNYLNLTLTPSNPILHTTRLYSLFKNYNSEKIYDYIPLFYEEWDDDSSKTLLACDFEVQTICKSINIDLSAVKSLKEHYEADTIEKMTKKISSINSLKGLPTPSIRLDNGYVPDFSSRYFTADFPYGLAIIKQIADFANIDIPNINKIWDWYKNSCCCEKYFNYLNYQITNINELINFYKGDD